MKPCLRRWILGKTLRFKNTYTNWVKAWIIHSKQRSFSFSWQPI